MCLMVWLGTACPVRAVAEAAQPDPVTGHSCVEEVASDAPIRARLVAPNVMYVGSHEGCGCGYNSDLLAFEGFETVAEVGPLLGAMSDEERETFLAEQRSRERLKALITASLAEGRVEVYACWAGDEETPADAVKTVHAGWFTERTAPLEERVLYVVGAGE